MDSQLSLLKGKLEQSKPQDSGRTCLSVKNENGKLIRYEEVNTSDATTSNQRDYVAPVVCSLQPEAKNFIDDEPFEQDADCLSNEQNQ